MPCCQSQATIWLTLAGAFRLKLGPAMTEPDSSPRDDARTSLLRGGLAFGVAIVAITEALSTLGALTFRGVAVADGAALAAVAGLCWLTRGARARSKDAPHGERWPSFDRALVAGIVTILVLTLVVALAAAPNSIDTMGYHLSRVLHWIQNGSVEFYPTSDLRQLGHPPFTEYVFLHLVLLAGGDRLVNLVQWSACVLSLAAVTLLARELGAGRRGQLFAAVFAATIPKGILQATGAKNDWVLALWILCAIYFSLRLRRTAARSDAVYVASALGLALLTKLSASLFVAPFVGWLGVSSALRIPARKAAVIAGVAAFLFAAVIVTHATRNIRLFGSPRGDPTVMRNYSPAAHPVVTLFSNSIRNVALQLATPWQRMNRLVSRPVEWMHEVVGVDVNDPQTTYRRFKVRRPRFNHEILAGSPLHALLVGWAIAAVVLVRRWRARTDLVIYSAAVLAGLALFSVMLRFQAPNSRLLFPLFVIGAPVIGVLLGDVARPRIAQAVAIVLLVLAPLWIGFSGSRPLLGAKSVLVAPRIEQYFAMRRKLRAPYETACERIRSGGHRSVGLVIHDGYMIYEYPIWKLLESVGEPVRIEHVSVTNRSAQFYRDEPFISFHPTAVLVISTRRKRGRSEPTMTLDGTTYARTAHGRGFALYEQTPS